MFEDSQSESGKKICTQKYLLSGRLDENLSRVSIVKIWDQEKAAVQHTN